LIVCYNYGRRGALASWNASELIVRGVVVV